MNKDQKSLELLYEQVSGREPFPLIKEEEALFDKAAAIITKEAWKVIKAEGDLNFYNHTSLSQIVHGLSDALKPKEMVVKYFPKEIQDEASMIYFAGIIYYLPRNKIFLKRYYEPEDGLFFDFETSYLLTNVKRKVNINDKEKFFQTLKEWFVNHFEFLFPSFEHSHPDWAKWREERLKFQGVKEKLPELEGIF
jgi:hypothetical protein